MEKVLVTGSNGFIGKKLIERLRKDGVIVVEFSRNLGKNVIKGEDFKDLETVDTVFHLAAVSGYKDCSENINLAYKVNVKGTVNVLEYCCQVGAKLIFPSTYVYDQPYEKIKTETDLIKPTTDYSFTKFLGEELCRFYSRVFKVNTLILRTSNVYGFGQEDKYLVPKIFNHILKNEEFVLTKPEIERSFIYIDDLVEAYIRLAESKTQPGQVFNIGPEKPTTLQQLIEIIGQVTGETPKVNYAGIERPREVNLNRVDISKMIKTINWKPKTNLNTGLGLYLEPLISELKSSHHLQ